MAELRHKETATAADTSPDKEAAIVAAEESAAQDSYDPKHHSEKDLRLTWCEKFIILLGAVVVVIIMVLVHHPEIYDQDVQPDFSQQAHDSLEQLGAGALTTSSASILVHGWATPEGTSKYASTKNGYQENYRIDRVSGLTLSSVGIGTYLGDATDEVDLQLEEAVYYSVSKGINVIDTAINYRGQRSERAIRVSLRKLFGAGVSRESVFVSTKAGFVPADSQKRLSPQKTVASWAAGVNEFPNEEVVGGKHCIAPICLNNSLHSSRANLGLYTIDLLYLHNSAEKQLEAVDIGVFMARLKTAFEFLESQRAINYLRYYGLATWACFTSDPESEAYLSLFEVVALAEAVGGPNHGFRYVQLPVSVTLPAAAVDRHQGDKLTLLEAAVALNVSTMSSRSVGGARFDTLDAVQSAYQMCTEKGLGSEEGPSSGLQYDSMLRAALASGSGSSKQKEAGMLPLSAPAISLLAVRSIPGVTTALVGMKDPKHIKENLHTMKFRSMDAELVACIMSRGGSGVGGSGHGGKFDKGGEGEGREGNQGEGREGNHKEGKDKHRHTKDKKHHKEGKGGAGKGKGKGHLRKDSG